MTFTCRVLPLLLVLVAMVAGYTAGNHDSEVRSKRVIAALDRQVDMLVEMQNNDKDGFEMAQASMSARIRELEARCK